MTSSKLSKITWCRFLARTGEGERIRRAAGLSLADVALPGDVVAGSTTLWDCSFNDANSGVGGSLAWMTTMEDESGAVLDCAIWGFESENYWNTWQGLNCLCFDVDGDCSN